LTRKNVYKGQDLGDLTNVNVCLY